MAVRTVIRHCAPPAVTLKQVHDETIKDESLNKLKENIKRGSQKTCAENPRTKQISQVFSELCVLDDIILLVKTKRKCKLSTPYESQPYIITKVKGTMIVAKRLPDGKMITRNASYFKLLEMPMCDILSFSTKDIKDQFQNILEEKDNDSAHISNPFKKSPNGRNGEKVNGEKSNSQNIIVPNPQSEIECENQINPNIELRDLVLVKILFWKIRVDQTDRNPDLNGSRTLL
ncbi:hypothetical protein SNE40_001662 [Patella caerulea]|uniref:Uncharacterized protein n=1 Tax=Patella caerulea TaxID=87958 RepID=A0AAN8Q3A0_PATCE